MFYGKYHFHCLFTGDAILPPYKGSTFRGVFGHALKKVVCALKHQKCQNCLLKNNCIYAFVFETRYAIDLPENFRTTAPPHPFVIEPPDDTTTFFKKGSAFDFSLILFGETNNSLPYFIYALDQMGKMGIGKKVDGKRGQFCLSSVSMNNTVIYSESDRSLRPGWSPCQLKLRDNTDCSCEIRKICVTLETPLRLKFQNHLNADLPFHVLVRAMLRRLSLLFSVYGNGEPNLNYRQLVSDANSIKCMDSNLYWYDWKRYSQRQDSKMFMGGMIGTVVYHGHINQFLPLLDLASRVHLGKQTAFGLGKISVEVQD
jgi:hypothetical protein